MTWHQLTCFGDTVAPDWLLKARLKRVSHRCLALDYELVAPAAEVIWPTASISPQRRDELWLSTCLELFTAPPLVSRIGRSTSHPLAIGTSTNWTTTAKD